MSMFDAEYKWNALRDLVYEANVAKGFNTPGVDRNVGEMVALMHSEISEATIASIKREPDDKLPQHDGVDVEIADTLIRLMDFSGVMKIDLELHLAQAPDIYTVAAVLPYSGIVEDFANIHVGLSYMLEAHRKSAVIPMTNTRRLDVETVTTLAMLLSICHKYMIDIDRIVDDKMAFNATRPFKHAKNY